jgi:hypothetical protein
MATDILIRIYVILDCEMDTIVKIERNNGEAC